MDTETIKQICNNKGIDFNENIERQEVLTELISNSNNYFENYKEFESNCFLLDGIWGSGKTWTIEVFKEYLSSEYLEEEFLKDVRIESLSAWQYADEKELFLDLWEFLNEENIITSLLEIKDKPEIIGDILIKRKWGVLFNVTKLFKSKEEIFENEILPVIRFIIDNSENIISVVDLASPGFGFLIKCLSKSLVVFSKYINIDYYEKINKFISGMKEKEISENINDKKQILDEKLNLFLKTIIVIDDLDRAHETKLWRVLTLLSLFDRHENLLFICVGSSNYLIKILENKYHVKGEGENFLTKFFAKEFKLPEADYISILTNDFFETKDDELYSNQFLYTFLKKIIKIESYRIYKTYYKMQMQTFLYNNNLDTVNKLALILKLSLLKNYDFLYNQLNGHMYEQGVRYKATIDYENYLKKIDNGDELSKNIICLVDFLVGRLVYKNYEVDYESSEFFGYDGESELLEEIKKLNIFK